MMSDGELSRLEPGKNVVETEIHVELILGSLSEELKVGEIYNLYKYITNRRGSPTKRDLVQTVRKSQNSGDDTSVKQLTHSRRREFVEGEITITC